MDLMHDGKRTRSGQDKMVSQIDQKSKRKVLILPGKVLTNYTLEEMQIILMVKRRFKVNILVVSIINSDTIE